MEFKPNDNCTTSESAPLIEPADYESDRDLFMVPLKRPSPRLPPSRYRNVKPRSPPRTPTSLAKQQLHPRRSPPMKPGSPRMFGSPLMSPESGSGSAQRRPSANGSTNPFPGSLAYHSPPLSRRGTKAGSSAILSPDPASSRGSPQPGSSVRETTMYTTFSADKGSPSTKASSVYDSPPATNKHEKATDQQQPPEIPALSAARGLRSNNPAIRTTKAQDQAENLGLALQLALPTAVDPSLLTVPQLLSAVTRTSDDGEDAKWTVPDSPMERLSQLRATPDSAYDRARQMEVRRSEWKRAVYRFPVRGKTHWVIDADLTESSHARLADVARRSSEGFEWNGDYELANIYRVLAVAHGRVVEEMRNERRMARAEVVAV